MKQEIENSDKIKNKILAWSEKEKRIRAVLLNGSRANSNVNPDKYQDYDILMVVENLESFLSDRTWISYFGNPILQQLPDEMELGKNPNEEKHSFTFLIIFEDYTRIDLSLYPIEKFEKNFISDSLTMVWLDKDQLFNNIPPASEMDYHVRKPDQQEFTEVCNEFWWNITNVAKGLKRGEIIYVKDLLENVVRPVFWQMIAWNIGMENDFKVNVGKSGKFAKQFLKESVYNEILMTYSNSDIERNWKALFLMAEIFEREQTKLAEGLNLNLNRPEAVNSMNYLKAIRID